MNLTEISVERDPDQEIRRVIQQGLIDSNVELTGDPHVELVFVVARDSNSKVIGGLVGEAYWGWVNFTTVWVHPEHRRQGVASQMLREAENEAVRKGYKQAYLDTFSFQSPSLYLKAGYEIFGQLENFPSGGKRFFMRKTILKNCESLGLN